MDDFANTVRIGYTAQLDNSLWYVMLFVNLTKWLLKITIVWYVYTDIYRYIQIYIQICTVNDLYMGHCP